MNSIQLLAQIVDKYSSDEYIKEEDLLDMQRTLVGIQFELTEINIQAFNDFNRVCYQFEGSNAAAQVTAHERHPELRQTRKLLEVVKSTQIAIQNELKRD